MHKHACKDQEPPLPQPAAPALVPPAGGDSAVSQLIPGSEVRVTLDHIIEDALVVSFRLGEKLFSGVLMDLSKRYRARPQQPPGTPRQSSSQGFGLRDGKEERKEKKMSHSSKVVIF